MRKLGGLLSVGRRGGRGPRDCSALGWNWRRSGGDFSWMGCLLVIEDLRADELDCCCDGRESSVFSVKCNSDEGLNEIVIVLFVIWVVILI